MPTTSVAPQRQCPCCGRWVSVYSPVDPCSTGCVLGAMVWVAPPPEWIPQPWQDLTGTGGYWLVYPIIPSDSLAQPIPYRRVLTAATGGAGEEPIPQTLT